MLVCECMCWCGCVVYWEVLVCVDVRMWVCCYVRGCVGICRNVGMSECVQSMWVRVDGVLVCGCVGTGYRCAGVHVLVCVWV